jgi:aminopeptidase YwaD
MLKRLMALLLNPNLMKHLAFLFLFLIAFFQLSAQTKLVPDITTGELQKHISYLASDELGGRYPGTVGASEAAEYIRDSFREYGLTLIGKDGFQEFEIVIKVSAGPDNALRAGAVTFVPGTDFTPFPFSQTASVIAPVVFAGYGFDISKDSLVWNDYEGIDVSGKWVMILRGDPEMDKQESHYAAYGEDRDKVIMARDKGAAGVLMVSGKSFDEKDNLAGMFFDKSQSNVGLPVIHIKRPVADQILAKDGLQIESLEKELIASKSPHSRTLDEVVSATAQIIQDKVTARNVVGMIEGSDPVLKNSYIIIGGHYDHLGMGGPGSGSRLMDSLAIHNGADDNASGTAGVIEIAGKLAAHRGDLKRSIVFVAFDGEEQGLLGSRYFVKNPLIDLKSVDAMVNFDMIGRLNVENRSVAIGGSGTSKESDSLLNESNDQDLKLGLSPEGYGPSDHAAFYAENIPVFFFSTGAHEDYHTPDDDWDRINYPGEVDVLDFAYNLVLKLAGPSPMLTFQEAGPKEQAGRAGYRFKVTLGIMPDFTGSSDVKGLGVGGVKKDGPAYKGGILKGDIIIAMDGKSVNDIYDYMNRLKTFQPGQVVAVDVIRDGSVKVLIIQL